MNLKKATKLYKELTEYALKKDELCSITTPCRRTSKETTMDQTKADKLYQEYADQCAMENGDLYSSDTFGQHLAQSPVWKSIDRLKSYKERLVAKALEELKSKQEWRDMEANDIRHKASGAMREMKAYDLLDRYIAKIQRSYKAEYWYHKELDACDERLASLEDWLIPTKSKARRLKHWHERRIALELKYNAQIQKTHRYESLINKWRGIAEVIYQADIAKEIAAERNGDGNKYGFNPNMQSRGTATDMHTND